MKGMEAIDVTRELINNIQHQAEHYGERKERVRKEHQEQISKLVEDHEARIRNLREVIAVAEHRLGLVQCLYNKWSNDGLLNGNQVDGWNDMKREW